MHPSQSVRLGPESNEPNHYRTNGAINAYAGTTFGRLVLAANKVFDDAFVQTGNILFFPTIPRNVKRFAELAGGFPKPVLPSS